MNWGTKLVIGMITFMAFIIVLGVMMFNSDTDGLVDTDYYEKGLNYDQEYEKKERVMKEDAAPSVEIDSQELRLVFKDHVKGTIRLQRTADKRLDRITSIESDRNNAVVLPLEGIASGVWRMVLEWDAKGESYLYEQELTLP